MLCIPSVFPAQAHFFAQGHRTTAVVVHIRCQELSCQSRWIYKCVLISCLFGAPLPLLQSCPECFERNVSHLSDQHQNENTSRLEIFRRVSQTCLLKKSNVFRVKLPIGDISRWRDALSMLTFDHFHAGNYTHSQSPHVDKDSLPAGVEELLKLHVDCDCTLKLPFWIPLHKLFLCFSADSPLDALELTRLP